MLRTLGDSNFTLVIICASSSFKRCRGIDFGVLSWMLLNTVRRQIDTVPKVQAGLYFCDRRKGGSERQTGGGTWVGSAVYPTLIHVTLGPLLTPSVPLCPCLENGLIAWLPRSVARFNELMTLEYFELQMKVIAQNKACWWLCIIKALEKGWSELPPPPPSHHKRTQT